MVEPIEPEPVQEEPEETPDEPEAQEPAEAPPVPAGIEQRQEVEERTELLKEDLVTEMPRTEEVPVQPLESPAPLVKVREVAKPSPPQIPLETVETFSPPSRDPPPSEPEKRDPPRPPVESPAPESPQREGDRPEKGVTSPVVVQGLARPEYPRYSRIHGEEGRVLLSVVVHADGTPGNSDDDCDDNPATGGNNFPTNTEVCDAQDNNCVSGVDEGFDTDNDNFTTCGADGNVSATADNDCDDGDGAINPDETEVCDASDNDEDCDGLADDNDPSVTGQQTYYPDADSDNFGDESDSGTASCDQPTGSVTDNTDCDESDATMPGQDADCDGVLTAADCDDNDANNFPGNTEICDGADNDCNFLADMDLAGEIDYDGDGWLSCSDCDDNDPNQGPCAE